MAMPSGNGGDIMLNEEQELQISSLKNKRAESALQEEEAKNARLEETQANVVLQIQEKQSLTERETLKKENEENLRKKELTMRESKQKMEKYLKQYDGLFRTTHSLTEAMQLQWQKNVELHKENVQVEHELTVKEQQIQTITRDAVKTDKLMEIAREQLQDIEGNALIAK
ncbi:hypothetical protein PInf_016973 [Phytophthora infestans]|nr:hypothetical protein PInf_016973 [Phytophthora infestans]